MTLERTTQPKTLIEKLEREVNRLRELRAQEKPHSLGYVFLGHHIAATVNAINIVKQHSDWVSVDERLPSDGDIVEVYRDSYKWGDLIWQCLYTKSKGFRNYPVDGVGKNEKITHWRPIQPPSEVQDANT